jgi:hypothetical protein
MPCTRVGARRLNQRWLGSLCMRLWTIWRRSMQVMTGSHGQLLPSSTCYDAPEHTACSMHRSCHSRLPQRIVDQAPYIHNPLSLVQLSTPT